MLCAKAGQAAQRRFKAEGRHPFAAANAALKRKFLAEAERERAAKDAAKPTPGDVAYLPLP
jgi:hypothetical protein